MFEPFGLLDETGTRRCLLLSDPPSGLRAILAIDDLALGPAAGSVRTARYPSFEAALREAQELARAMTLKCALADLGAGGAQVVVLDHEGLDRERAFEALGAHVEALDGLIRTSGDYGTTQGDLRAMARRTRYVTSDEIRLARAVAQGVLRCTEAALAHRGRSPKIEGMRVAIQGCGTMGASVAKLFAELGADLVVADPEAARAEGVAAETGADILDPEAIIGAEVDLFAPCARGRWLDVDRADALGAQIVCGSATNVLTGVDAARRLRDRGILFIPDAIASAGAVVENIGRAVMGLPDRSPLIDHLGRTVRLVLDMARDQGSTPHEAADALARRRLEEARART